MSRPFAREVAMKLLYSRMMEGEATPEAICEQSGIPAESIWTPQTENRSDCDKASKLAFDRDDYEFAESIAAGVAAHEEELDALISRFAKDWSITRLSRVDLTILRISAYELLYRPDVPRASSIDAAVELAKTYGGEKSAPFINGILGSVERETAK